MSDGRSGSVRQWLRHVRSCSRGAAGVVMPTGHRPCSPGLAGAVACGSSGSGRVSGCAPHELPYLRWLPQGPPRARAGSRRTGGGRAPVQGVVRPPQTPAWPLSPACPRVPDTGRPDGGSSASSGRLISDRSGWLPSSSSFLRGHGLPDPSDCLMTATAVILDVPLVTRDDEIASAGVAEVL
jgi:hypothetical protein